MLDLSELETRLGVSFRDPDLLARALVHGSYLNEAPTPRPQSNERLEFLGDAVIGLVVADWLHDEFPGAGEGELTRRRMRLISGATLARAAAGVGLGEYLTMSRGEAGGGGSEKPRNLAGAFEAVIAALYLDRGLVACADLLRRLLWPLAYSASADAKSRLQEYLQSQGRGLPDYVVTASSGAPHRKTFNVAVSSDGKLLGRGRGSSRKAAETRAAAAALKVIGEPDA